MSASVKRGYLVGLCPNGVHTAGARKSWLLASTEVQEDLQVCEQVATNKGALEAALSAVTSTLAR